MLEKNYIMIYTRMIWKLELYKFLILYLYGKMILIYFYFFKLIILEDIWKFN